MNPKIAIPFPNSADPAWSERVMPDYAGSIEHAGGTPVPVALDLPVHEIMRIATHCDGVLLPGSRADVNPQKYGAARDEHTADSDPLRDNVDELLIQDAYGMRKPILAICFGVQILNVWRTGALVQHLESGVQHTGEGAQHAVAVEPDSLLASITNAKPVLMVNSSHHQAIATPGDGLKVVARCFQDGVIEAVESTTRDHFVMGVQWHPERMSDPASLALFRAFVDAARDWRSRVVPDFETLSR